MHIDDNVRRVLFIVFIALALLPSMFLLGASFQTYSSTDAQLSANFSGMAPEDVGGFWFWPLWVVLAFLEVSFLAPAWHLLSHRLLRRVVTGIFVLFVVSSGIDYGASARECRLWFAYVSADSR